MDLPHGDHSRERNASDVVLTMKFYKPKAGEWVEPVKKGYLMSCCDCGLVHSMDFRVKRGRAQFRAFRAPKVTKRQRRKRNIRVLH